MQDRPKNYSKSANRALDVMDYFARTGAPARAADIADALGIARSSADQLLKTMVFDGYLALSAEGRTYFPSLRMARFGHWIAARYPDFDRYRAIVEDIHGKTGEVVTLSMQNDCFMQLTTAIGLDDGDPLLGPGGRVPVLGSAIGGAAMTTKTPKAINRLVERARRQRALMAGARWDAPFVEEIRLFRMKGYSWRPTRRFVERGDDKVPIEFWSIAMAMPGPGETPNVVLGLAGPTPRVRGRERELVNLMRRSIRLHLAN